MTTYYVGKGGNDVNAGTSWALRKLTLNGAEDIPVVAADNVFVGPGVYRETLTIDVNGSAGNEIEYIADVLGENTDGAGGEVRVTGSDNDNSETRTTCINNAGNFDYRTFRGFHFDLASSQMIDIQDGTNWTIEDCTFLHGNEGIRTDAATDLIVRRCFFMDQRNSHIIFSNGIVVTGRNILVENCLFVACGFDGIANNRVGGVTIQNCTFIGAEDDLIDVAITAGTGSSAVRTEVYNCIFIAAGDFALEANVLGDIVEDYNTFYNNDGDRSNVATGGNSQVYAPLLDMPILRDGFRLPYIFGSLNFNSDVARIAQNAGYSQDDIFGYARPGTNAKVSLGAVQFMEQVKETSTIRTGTASLAVPDAGRIQFRMPVSPSTSTTVETYVYREANYAGTLPQMIIREPGQADRVTTDTGSASAWNQLTDTWTTQSTTNWVLIILVSNNTAAAGSYATYFDDLAQTI